MALIDMVNDYQKLLEKKESLAEETKDNNAKIEALKQEIAQQMIDDDCPRIAAGDYMYAYGAGGSTTDNIILPDVYSYQPVGGLIPLPKIWFHNTVKVHAWTGVQYENEKNETANQPMVYVTESGTVYHRKLGCSYLNLSVQQISGAVVKTMKNTYGEKYQACELCSRGQEPAGVVYITKKSNRYHNRENCSGLKRSVRMVKESEVSGEMSACGRCG